MENVLNDTTAKTEKTKARVIHAVSGFSPITTANVEKYKKGVEGFLVDRKFKWFLSDTLGMTTSWKKGEKFERFMGAMEDHSSDAEVGETCAELKVLAMQVADIDPKSIVFESGSAAEREYGKAIDKRIEKDEKAVAVEAAKAEINGGVTL